MWVLLGWVRIDFRHVWILPSMEQAALVLCFYSSTWPHSFTALGHTWQSQGQRAEPSTLAAAGWPSVVAQGYKDAVFFVSSYFFPPLLGLPVQSNLNWHNCGIRDILQILGLVKMFIWIFCKMLGKTWMNFWAHPILLCTDISDLKYTHPWLTSICKHTAQRLIPQRTLLRSFPRSINAQETFPHKWETAGPPFVTWRREVCFEEIKLSL